jgi:hypothetical protein
VPAYDLARAGATCARASFPVDVAVALAVEAIQSVDERRLSPLLAEPPLLPHSPIPPEFRAWVEQLERGCGWYEDDLPFVQLPARLMRSLRDDVMEAATAVVADEAQLSALRKVEHFAVASGARRLADVLATACAGR